MEPQKYLENVLKGQNLKEDSEQIKNLGKHRDEVESLLRDGFSTRLTDDSVRRLQGKRHTNPGIVRLGCRLLRTARQ